MNLETLLIHKDKTLLEALGKLDAIRNFSRRILFVVEDDGSLLGSLTDGDIRRSLIANKDIYQSVGAFCNKSFLFEFNRRGYVDLKDYRKKDIKILPLVDENKKLVKIIDLERTKSILPVECMIMAGGRGKRLSPLTDSTPKPMLPLGGKPIIEHNIDRLISFGIEKIYISVKYLGEQIKEYFGDGSEKGIKIDYIWEDEPLGTAGALSLVDKFETEYVLLMNSDLFTNIDFEELYRVKIESRADMAVASTEYKINVPYAVFKTEQNKVKEFKEKPSFVYHSNAGIYLFDKNLINRIPKNKFYDITDLMENLVQSGGELVHCPILGFWIDIGNPVDYEQAKEFIKHSGKLN